MYIHIAEGSTAMKRTTILADEGLLREAKQLAARRRITFTTLVQEALREYLIRFVRPRPCAACDLVA
jgi:hypothetical protein